ncbi:MAG: SDR family NAD(P)-dependent oxidoreductase [Endomicrobiia bacterium]|nr:SDR family NAD(P)-dependent oxidoreductase [Endomicrobiia bacterium]
MKTLVTGAAGFIGTRVTEELLRRGHKVFCLVRTPAKAAHLEKSGAVIIKGDVTDAESLRSSMERPDDSSRPVEAVVNCAGVLRARDTARYYTVNRDAVATMGGIAKNIAARIVHISSLAAFGPSRPGKPRSLLDAPAPVSEYGRSKLEGTLALAASGARFTIIVPSAVYGPRDKDMFFFFKAVSMGLGISTRPMRFIQLSFSEDVAAACAVAVETREAEGKTYCVADPVEYSWSHVCETIALAAGKKIFRVTAPDTLISVAAFISQIAAALLGRAAVFNTDKAREMLQSAWTCSGTSATEKDLGVRATDFASGASKTYNWYKQNRWL